MISVIVPAYNASKTIAACLNALQTQKSCESNYEILVVDDGSTDATPTIVQGFDSVVLIRQPNSGPAAARNAGVRAAKGDIILFTDSDCVPLPNWIEQMLAPFKNDPQIVAVKGAYRTLQIELPARFVQIEYEDKYDQLKKTSYIDFIDTYSAGFKRDIFLQFGGYDTIFPVACTEDIDLSFRMSSKGCKMVFNPNAVVYHLHPATLGAYCRKKYKFAYWKLLTVKKNPGKAIRDSHTPQLMKAQMMLLPAFMGSLLLSLTHRVSLMPAIAVVVLFLSSTIPFSVKAFRKDKTVGILSPLFLTARSVFQFLGVLSGSRQLLHSGTPRKSV